MVGAQGSQNVTAAWKQNELPSGASSKGKGQRQYHLRCGVHEAALWGSARPAQSDAPLHASPPSNSVSRGSSWQSHWIRNQYVCTRLLTLLALQTLTLQTLFKAESCPSNGSLHTVTEEEMAACSSILAWKIPWTEGPGGLQSEGTEHLSAHTRACTRTPAHVHTHTHTHKRQLMIMT